MRKLILITLLLITCSTVFADFKYIPFGVITPTGAGGGGLTPENDDSNSTSSQSASLTIPSFSCSHTNDYIAVAIALGNSAAVSTVTYNGESFSELVSREQYTETFIWGGIPSAASGDIVITPGASTSIVARAFCYSGVDQTTPIDATNHTGASGATSINQTITTVTDGAVIISIAGVDVDSISGGAVQDGDQTNFEQVDATVFDIIHGLTSTEEVATAGGESNGYTWTESSDASISQIALRPAE